MFGVGVRISALPYLVYLRVPTRVVTVWIRQHTLEIEMTQGMLVRYQYAVIRIPIHRWLIEADTQRIGIGVEEKIDFLLLRVPTVGPVVQRMVTRPGRRRRSR